MAEEQSQAVDATENPASNPEETVASAASETDIAVLAAEVVRLRQENQTNLDGWQRSRAEFTNYKRRTMQELAEARDRGALDALTKLLPVVDDFERAFTNIPADLQSHPWMNGTSLILKNFQKVLDEFNISIIDPVGQEFDPTMHEAIGMEESTEYASGIVSTTLQKGYKSGEKVLRPALVRVAS